jgi:aryl-alcohol dehydrogenase-like predicted oxidoreductase
VQLSTTVDALALAAAIAQPFQPMVLSGAATPAQLHSNFQAVELAGRLPQGLVGQLQAELRQEPKAYWSQRAALAWN